MDDLNGGITPEGLYDLRGPLLDDAHICEGAPLKGCRGLGNELVDAQGNPPEMLFSPGIMIGCMFDFFYQLYDGVDIPFFFRREPDHDIQPEIGYSLLHKHLHRPMDLFFTDPLA